MTPRKNPTAKSDSRKSSARLDCSPCLARIFPEPLERLDPLEALARAHDAQEELCDILETIADGLPDNVDPEVVEVVCIRLREELPLHHRDEEEGLFPLLLARMTEQHDGFGMFAELNRQHVFDDGYAEEITVMLERMAAPRTPPDCEMLGYMLRGFFEGYRRHIRWENTVLLPLARRMLDASDIQELSRRMVAHRIS